MLLGEVAELCFAAAREADADGFRLGLTSSARSARQDRHPPTSDLAVEYAPASRVPQLASRQSIASHKLHDVENEISSRSRTTTSYCGAALALKAQALQAELEAFGIVESAVTRRAAKQWHLVALYDIYLCWCQFTWQATRIRRIDYRHLILTLACFFTEWRMMAQKYTRHRASAIRLKSRIEKWRRSLVIRRWSCINSAGYNARKLGIRRLCRVLRLWSDRVTNLQMARAKVEQLGKCRRMIELACVFSSWVWYVANWHDACSLAMRMRSQHLQQYFWDWAIVVQAVCIYRGQSRGGFADVARAVARAWKNVSCSAFLVWKSFVTYAESDRLACAKAMVMHRTNTLRLFLRCWYAAYEQFQRLCHNTQASFNRSTQRQGLLKLHEWTHWRQFNRDRTRACRIVWRRRVVQRAIIVLRSSTSKLRLVRRTVVVWNKSCVREVFRRWAEATSTIAKACETAEEIKLFLDAQLLTSVFKTWGSLAVRRQQARLAGLAIQLCRRQLLLEEWKMLPRIIKLKKVQTRRASASAVKFWNWLAAHRQQHRLRSFNAAVFYQRLLADSVVTAWRAEVMASSRLRQLEKKIAWNSCTNTLRKMLSLWQSVTSACRFEKIQVKRWRVHRVGHARAAALTDWNLFALHRRHAKRNIVRMSSNFQSQAIRCWCQQVAQRRKRKQRNLTAYRHVSSKMCGKALQAWLVCIEWFRMVCKSREYMQSWLNFRHMQRGWESLSLQRPGLAFQRSILRHRQHLASLSMGTRLQVWRSKAVWWRRKRLGTNVIRMTWYISTGRRFLCSWYSWIKDQKRKIVFLSNNISLRAQTCRATTCFAEWCTYAAWHVNKRILLAKARARIAVLRKCRILDDLRNFNKQRQLGQVVKKMYITKWRGNIGSRRSQREQLIEVAERRMSYGRKEALRCWHRHIARRVCVRSKVTTLQYHRLGRVACHLFFAWVSYLAEQRLHHMASEMRTLHILCRYLDVWSHYIDLVAHSHTTTNELVAEREQACCRRCWYDWKHFVFGSWPTLPNIEFSEEGAIVADAKARLQCKRKVITLHAWLQILRADRTFSIACRRVCEHRRKCQLQHALGTCLRYARIHGKIRHQASLQKEYTSSSTFQAWREFAMKRSRHDQAINEASLAKYKADTKQAICTWHCLAASSRQKSILSQLATEHFHNQLLMAALSAWRLMQSLQCRLQQLAQTVWLRDMQASLRFCIIQWIVCIRKQKRLIQMTIHCLQVDEDRRYLMRWVSYHSWRHTVRQLKWIQRQNVRASFILVSDIAPLCLSVWHSRSTKRRLKREDLLQAARQCSGTAWHQAAWHWQNWAARRRAFKQLLAHTLREWSSDAESQCFRAWLLYRVRKHHQGELSARLTSHLVSTKVRKAFDRLRLKALSERRIRQFALEGAHRWARSSAHRVCHTWFAKLEVRRRQHQIQERVDNQLKGWSILSWRYGTARIQGASEIAERRAVVYAKVAVEVCFKTWLSKVIQCYDIAAACATRGLVDRLQIAVRTWHLTSQDKRRRLRLTLQAISCVAQKRQNLALRRWHGNTCRRSPCAIEEAHANILLSDALQDGSDEDRAILPVPSDWFEREVDAAILPLPSDSLETDMDRAILPLPSEWLEFDSGFSTAGTDSWDLIAT